MSTDCRIFVLRNALMKVSGCVPDIICDINYTFSEVLKSVVSASLNVKVPLNFYAYV